jgi:hypothetical protein
MRSAAAESIREETYSPEPRRAGARPRVRAVRAVSCAKPRV